MYIEGINMIGVLFEGLVVPLALIFGGRPVQVHVKLGENAVGEVRRTDRFGWNDDFGVEELPPPKPYHSLDGDFLAPVASKTHVGMRLVRAASAVCLAS